MSTPSARTGRALKAASVNRPLAVLRHLLKVAHEEWGLTPAPPRVRLEAPASDYTRPTRPPRARGRQRRAPGGRRRPTAVILALGAPAADQGRHRAVARAHHGGSAVAEGVGVVKLGAPGRSVLKCVGVYFLASSSRPGRGVRALADSGMAGTVVLFIMVIVRAYKQRQRARGRLMSWDALRSAAAGRSPLVGAGGPASRPMCSP